MTRSVHGKFVAAIQGDEWAFLLDRMRLPQRPLPGLITLLQPIEGSRLIEATPCSSDTYEHHTEWQDRGVLAQNHLFFGGIELQKLSDRKLNLYQQNTAVLWKK